MNVPKIATAPNAESLVQIARRLVVEKEEREDDLIQLAYQSVCPNCHSLAARSYNGGLCRYLFHELASAAIRLDQRRTQSAHEEKK